MPIFFGLIILFIASQAALADATDKAIPGTRMKPNWPELVSAGDITLSTPALDSYKGLLLGNGDVVASLFGPPELLTLHVGKNDIWDYRDPMDQKRGRTHKEFLDMYANPSKPAVANYLYDENSDALNVDIRKTYCSPMPTLKPAGRLRFRNPQAKGAPYEASLHLWDAEVTATFLPSAFVSYPRNLLVAHYDAGDMAEFDLELVRHKDSTGVIPADPEFGANGNDLWLSYEFPGDPNNYPNGFTYVMYARLLGADSIRSETVKDFAKITQALWREGQVALDPVETTEGVSVAHVRSSKPITVLLAVVTTRDDPNPFKRARHDVDEAERLGIDALTQEHRAFWHSYWRKSFVELEGRPFLNQVWFFSQYLLACSWRSGRIAPGLFGSWTWEDFPLFGNDYHWDYNMQQAVWGAYSSNHTEQARAYNETALALLPTAVADSKETYGIDGAKFFLATYPRKALHNPFPLLHYDKMMSLDGWVAHPLWWYYLYTQDKSSLRKELYPVLRECAKFYASYLTGANDGKYDIWPTAAWDVDFTPHLKSNRNFPMDLSFIRYVMNAAAEAAEILNVDIEKREEWRNIAQNLREYPTAETPSGKVFTAYPGSSAAYHFPLAAMMVFPGDDIGLDSDEDHKKTAARTVSDMTYSGDEQLLKAVIRARLGIDDLDAFEKQLKATTRPNGTISYGDQWFFWVHGAGNSVWLNENLMQSYNGRIRVAPVKIQTASRFQLRAVGGFLVCAEIGAEGDVAYISITSESGKACKLVNPWPSGIRVRRFPSLKPIRFNTIADYIEFNTQKDAVYVIDTKTRPWENQPIQ